MKKSKPYSFIPQKENAVSTWSGEGTAFPEKVAILYNTGTARSAEGMITYAVQREKVIRLGENSGGYIGFGNVMAATVPCGKFTLRSTTTKYKRNAQYEFIGIAPMVNLSSLQTDWVEAARQSLK
jgi:hypothetical protein